MNQKKKILIIGVLPPTLGGISSHVNNLSERLISDGWAVEIIDLITKGKSEELNRKNTHNPFVFLYFVFKYLCKGGRLIHIHSSIKAIPLILVYPISRIFGAKIILSIHGGQFSFWIRNNVLRLFFYKIIFKLADYKVFMSQSQLSGLHYWLNEIKNIYFIGPFIIPTENVNFVPYSIDENNANFKLVTMGLWQKIYNFEHVLAACELIQKEEQINIQLTIVSSSVSPDMEYKENIKKQAITLNSNKLIVNIIENERNIQELLKQQDLLIRANSFDSYGLCIAEALMYAVPAIATNVCKRPVGTIYYEFGNIKELSELIKEVIKDKKKWRTREKSLICSEEDSYLKLLELYQKIFSIFKIKDHKLAKVKKVIRFISIYGMSRTFVKIMGRTRINISLPNLKRTRSISIIGCGQFSFSAIAYFLYFNNKGRFLGCFDIKKEEAKSMARFYNFKKIYQTHIELLNDSKCKLIYIASNHASHTYYAVEALRRNIDVYIEKPISVTFEQFKELQKAIKSSQSNVYIGYNRPHSKAIKYLAAEIKGKKQPISLSCFISGHKIESDHWYRKPEEGTRVCGNMGHWIDLMIHLFSQRGIIPSKYQIQITYADIIESDDNILVGISTDYHDIASIYLTSRSEPFEGINETINFQCDNIIAKIDDFRKMTIWKDHNLINKNYWPKDVGHKNAILQPFNSQKRDFYEIECSTLLMLKIKDMVINKLNFSEYKIDITL